MTKRLAGVFVLTGALWAAGCDSGGGSSPKADANGAQFKELTPPASPAGGGGGGKAQPGPGAKAE